jgi:hypothetical protein
MESALYGFYSLVVCIVERSGTRSFVLRYKLVNKIPYVALSMKYPLYMILNVYIYNGGLCLYIMI